MIRPLALVLALGLGLTTLGGLGCKAKESEPVAVARGFAEAVRRGDVKGMLAVVERSAVERLRDAAETASDQVGGRRGIEPSEMLQIVGVDRTLAVAEAALIEEGDDRAVVELTMTDGRSLRLELVWEPAPESETDDEQGVGAWKVRIPVPRADAGRLEGIERPDA
ncbi:MAG: hypothetical protein R6X02_25000 [Enhygromyxa sp.]